MGQAKRRKVLRYLAARERAGIVGTGPFDLAEVLVRLDGLMLAGGQRGREAFGVAAELARTGERPKCAACHGFRSLLAYVQVWHPDIVPPLPGPCSSCRGTGNNIHAELPWPAWLRRKGQTIGALAYVNGRPGGWAGLPGFIPAADWRRFPAHSWVQPRPFAANCSNEGEQRVETRARSFPRGAHESHDPWQTMLGVRAMVGYTANRLPAWMRGEQRHADQRRERARRGLTFSAMMGDGRLLGVGRGGAGQTSELAQALGPHTAEAREFGPMRGPHTGGPNFDRERGLDAATAVGYALQADRGERALRMRDGFFDFAEPPISERARDLRAATIPHPHLARFGVRRP